MSLIGRDLGTLGSERGNSSFANAVARVNAMSAQRQHFCASVKSYVDNDACRSRFYAAKQEKQPGNPCAECSTVRMLVKKCAFSEVSNGK